MKRIIYILNTVLKVVRCCVSMTVLGLVALLMLPAGLLSKLAVRLSGIESKSTKKRVKDDITLSSSPFKYNIEVYGTNGQPYSFPIDDTMLKSGAAVKYLPEFLELFEQTTLDKSRGCVIINNITKHRTEVTL